MFNVKPERWLNYDLVGKNIRQEKEISAEEMLHELLNNRLSVCLIPAPDARHAEHKIRVVEEANAKWYQDFCALYPSGRKGTKIRTRIKRRLTIKALNQILEGKTQGVYVERLLDFIEKHTVINDVPF